MLRSTRSSLFPDVNVWVALTLPEHVRHEASPKLLDWVPDDSELFFCLPLRPEQQITFADHLQFDPSFQG